MDDWVMNSLVLQIWESFSSLFPLWTLSLFSKRNILDVVTVVLPLLVEVYLRCLVSLPSLSGESSACF